MSQVSLYKNNRDTKGFEPVKVQDIYDAIKESESWKGFAQSVRQFPYKSDNYDLAKDKVPAFTMSGVFPEHQRNDSSLLSHSNRIVMDIDGLEDSVEDVKQALMEDQYTESVFLSVGGLGLAVVVKIDGSEHLRSFLQLEQYYINNYNLKIDQSCKNTSRVRYVTSDPDIYVNMDSPVFEIEQEELFTPEQYNLPASKNKAINKSTSIAKEIIKRSVNLIEQATEGGVHHAILKASELAGGYIAGGFVDEMEIKESMLSAILQKPKALDRKLEEKKVNDGIRHGKTKPITELMVDKSKQSNKNDYKDYGIKWFEIKDSEKEKYKEILATASLSNKEGRKIDPSFIQSLSEMNDIPIDKVAEIFKKVYELDKLYFNFSKKSEIDKTEIHINEKYELRLNIVKNSIDSREKGTEKEFEQCNSNDIYRYLQKIRSKYSKANLESLLGSGFVEEYDPFKKFFKELPEWNKEDEIKKLCSFIKTNDDEFFYNMLKKHLVRSISCSMGESVNRFVFTLVSEAQETGKSSFVRWINPLPKQYYTETSINGNAKDLKISLCQNFIMNIDELAGLGKKDIESLKSMISEESINERMPYGKNTVSMPRRVNFFASTNNSNFLTDSSNTRWLCFEIKSIDWRGYSKEVDKTNLWSQAYHLYKSGFDAQLNKEESEKRNKINETHESETPELSAIRKHFKVCEENEGEFYSSFEITEKLNQMYLTAGIKFSQYKVAQETKKMNFKTGRKRINGKFVRGFYAEMVMMKFQEINEKEGKKPF